MNQERIKELASQARKYADDNEEHWKSGPSWDSLFEQKFAELIVKECAKYVKNTNCFTYASQADLCAERMKQHFGVEE